MLPLVLKACEEQARAAFYASWAAAGEALLARPPPMAADCAAFPAVLEAASRLAEVTHACIQLAWRCPEHIAGLGLL
jgi:hypothetical protein